MIRFRSITIEGFRSFRERQTFTFPTRRGFYFMGGLNKADPRKGPNGVGKSTFWDALLWCLSGVTSRGIKGPRVRSWNETEKCSVEVSYKRGEHGWTIRRTQSPNTLAALHDGTTEWQPLTQEEFEKDFGANFEVITSTVLMSQFGRYFFDLTATDKLTLFSGLFDLDHWLGCADRARAASKAADGRAVKASETVARRRGSITSLKGRLVESQALATAWEERHGERTTAAKDRVQHLREVLDGARSSWRDSERKRDGWAAKKSDTQQALVRADEQLRDVAEPAFRKADEEVKRLIKSIETLQDEVDEAKRLKEATCPTCYGDVDPSRIRRVIRKIEEDKIVPLQQRLDGAKVDRGTARAIRDDAQTTRTSAEKAFVEAEERTEHYRRLTSDSLSIVRDKERELATAETNMAQATAEQNPHSATLDSIELELTAARAERDIAKSNMEAANTEKDRADYWVGAFKDLRLWIIERALLDFEICVNNALSDLGLSEWKVSFDVERTTQAGTVSKGFTVLIQSPESKEPVPWEEWSGGETQRLRLAGAIGLSDLVRARGFQPGIEVWDEPTQHLSREGVEDMLRFFRDRAQDQRRQVWLVDHVTQPGGEFDGSVVVVADRMGSHIGTPPTKKPRETF